MKKPGVKVEGKAMVTGPNIISSNPATGNLILRGLPKEGEKRTDQDLRFRSVVEDAQGQKFGERRSWDPPLVYSGYPSANRLTAQERDPWIMTRTDSMKKDGDQQEQEMKNVGEWYKSSLLRKIIDFFKI